MSKELPQESQRVSLREAYSGGVAKEMFVQADADFQMRKAQEESVMELYLRGTTDVLKISELTTLRPTQIRAIISTAKLRSRADVIQKEVSVEILAEKAPILKSIVGLNLSIIEEFLTKLHSDAEKKSNLTLTDIKDLSTISKNTNEMLRLELGESTANVAHVHTIQSTQVALDKLRTLDKVFDYPSLPAPEGEVDDTLV